MIGLMHPSSTKYTHIKTGSIEGYNAYYTKISTDFVPKECWCVTAADGNFVFGRTTLYDSPTIVSTNVNNKTDYVKFENDGVYVRTVMAGNATVAYIILG